MNPSFRDTDYGTLDDSRLLARWHADPSIRHLVVPQRDEAMTLRAPETAEEIRERRRRPGPFRAAFDQMIEVNGRPVGHCTLIFDPPHRLTREGKVAWFGITLGEEEYRAKGLGKKTMLHLERLAALHGADCSEAGIFEFNEASLRMCLALSYEKIGQREGMTYWKGRTWADIRLRKKLFPAKP
jgi:RimJ/RimL family protein N-acetyltransferase